VFLVVFCEPLPHAACHLSADADPDVVRPSQFQAGRARHSDHATVPPSSGSISAKSFFDYFGIPYDEPHSYELKNDTEKEELLVFYLAASQAQSIQ